ncbi:30S ribosomal protein S4 [candidate division WWE3 bacterium RIFCSPLOWO2_01_FULL_39_13]|uniref:Small ribosomal subunit protein uS4 n=1 Tax=candidate division WWE3 bacterium RIFCSPLOWO2_01_FULL_39_13 TaxID=1802624 RepID=A0A1F4V4L4_UNCKA|nr:MAG: 30S ribosomal protein S4 [candidate division WWE3 bacterium RIFCSPLOWO2_01_FULL_39_13]
MAKYTGAKCRLCRREGEKLFLKGSRCYSEKCSITKRNQVPGQHGKTGFGFASDYSKHLREKQKTKRIYGLLEAQFRRYFQKASKVKGVTGQVLLQMLETRLDSALNRAGAASSMSMARQMVRQNKIRVNDSPVNIPSYQLSAGDVITVEDIKSKTSEDGKLPEWLGWDAKTKGIKIERLPERDEISYDINEQLIVEFYSR